MSIYRAATDGRIMLKVIICRLNYFPALGYWLIDLPT